MLKCEEMGSSLEDIAGRLGEVRLGGHLYASESKTYFNGDSLIKMFQRVERAIHYPHLQRTVSKAYRVVIPLV